MFGAMSPVTSSRVPPADVLIAVNQTTRYEPSDDTPTRGSDEDDSAHFNEIDTPISAGESKVKVESETLIKNELKSG